MLLKRRVKVVIKLDVNPAKESKQPCSSKNTTEKRGKQNIWPKFRLFFRVLSINFQSIGIFYSIHVLGSKSDVLPIICNSWVSVFGLS